MAAWPQLRTNSAATDLHSRPAGIQSSACLDEWGSCIDLMKALRKLPNGIDAEALALCTMACCTVQAPLHLSRLWHPFKPCRCCLTAALDVLFETLLLEFCCIIVVVGLPALLFPWQFLPLHQSCCLPLCKAVLAGGDPLHFTLPLVEVKKKDRRLCPCHLAMYSGCFSPKAGDVMICI